MRVWSSVKNLIAFRWFCWALYNFVLYSLTLRFKRLNCFVCCIVNANVIVMQSFKASKLCLKYFRIQHWRKLCNLIQLKLLKIHLRIFFKCESKRNRTEESFWYIVVNVTLFFRVTSRRYDSLSLCIQQTRAQLNFI